MKKMKKFKRFGEISWSLKKLQKIEKKIEKKILMEKIEDLWEDLPPSLVVMASLRLQYG